MNYYEDLNFDRKAKCGWCGEKKTVSICHYGTTHYNRLVCPTCAKNIMNMKKYLEDNLTSIQII